MSQMKIGVRAWASFEVFSILFAVVQKSAQSDIASRSLAAASLRSAFAFYPEYSAAMLNAKLIPAEISVTSTESAVYSSLLRSEGILSELMREANDLSFGSTVREQLEFGYKLKAWATCNVPIESSVASFIYSPTWTASSQRFLEEYQRWRAPIFEVVNLMGRWVPTLGLSLELGSASNIADVVSKKGSEAESALQKALEAQGRLRISSETLSVQLSCLQRILGYSVSLELNYPICNNSIGSKTGAIPTILNVLREMLPASTLSDEPSKTQTKGLLNVVDHFTSLGLYSESAEVLNLVIATIQLITTIIGAAMASKNSSNRSEFVSGLLSRGVIKTICGALRFEAEYLRGVVKTKRVAAHLMNDHMRLIHSYRSAWDALLSIDDPSIAEGIELCGFSRLLAEEWLLDKTVLSLVSSTLSDRNPEAYVIANEAIELGRRMVARCVKSTLPHQISQQIFDSKVIVKIFDRMNTLTKRDPPMSLESLLKILAYLASINTSLMDGAFIAIKVPKSLLLLTRQLGCLHPTSVEAWSKWWACVTASFSSSASESGLVSPGSSPSKKKKPKDDMKSTIGAKELFKADKGKSIRCVLVIESVSFHSPCVF
jgi:hypothetical protein